MAKRKVKEHVPMFATIVIMNDREFRSGFKFDRAEVIEHAERNPGIIRVEEIGVGTIWTRPADE